MATLDQSGGSARFFSSGTTAEEHRQLEDTPGRIQFFEHIRRFPEPMRVSDFSSHLRSMGLGGVPSAVACGSVPCGPHPSPEGGSGQHLPRQGARRRGVHPRGRGDAGAVRLPSGPGHRQRPPVPGRTSRQGAPGDAYRHLSRRCRGLRRPDGSGALLQPGGGAAHGGRAAAGPSPGRPAPSPDRPALRWTGSVPRGLSPGPGAEQGRDGAGRGDSPERPRWPVGHRSGQRHSIALGGGRRGGDGGRHPTGHDVSE